MTALTCIVAGSALYTGRPWGKPLYLVAYGLLLYALAQAASYFLEQGDFLFATLFALFDAATLALLWRLIQPTGQQLLLGFLGLMLYATVQTAGYFAQEGDLVATLMFAALIICTLASTFAW
jgi:hypothetical protein